MTEHTPTPWEVYGASIRTVAEQEPRYVMELNSVHSANLATDVVIGSLSSPRGAEQRDIDAAFIVKAVNLHDALVAAVRSYAGLIQSDYEGRSGIVGGMAGIYADLQALIDKAEA